MTYYFDELIVSALRNENNSMALKELYRTHYPMILNLVRSNSGTEQEAKDIYQEAIIAFYEKLQRPEFTLTCRIQTYLYAVCHRLWLKKLSQKKKFSNAPLSGEGIPDLAADLADMEEKEKQFVSMGVSLESLGEPCRSIIVDFYMNDLSMENIRDRHGYSTEESAKNQKYKCLQRLKKIFFSHYDSRS